MKIKIDFGEYHERSSRTRDVLRQGVYTEMLIEQHELILSHSGGKWFVCYVDVKEAEKKPINMELIEEVLKQLEEKEKMPF